jgi:hypothetical protein
MGQMGGGIGGLASMNKNSRNDQFSISLPAGANVLALAGSADYYLRSIFAYYKI